MLSMRVAAPAGAIVFAVACGGQVIGGDGGTSGGDGSTTPTPTTSTTSNPPPTVDASLPPPLCSPMSGGGMTSSNGDCSVNEDWSCGATKYSVQCNCTGTVAQCSCSQYTANGGSGTMLPYTSGCPKCTVTGAQLAKLCGFPSN